jgi:3-methyladenine DNA glycosylase AlkD
MNAAAVKKALAGFASNEKAEKSAWFFKTGKGEYGEGDTFIGVTVPEQRSIAKQYSKLPFTEIKKLLTSKTHEHRFTALLILVEQYKKGDKKEKKSIVSFYLTHTDSINNWDLVDCSAPYIVGAFYVEYGGEEKLLHLAKSKNMWERRISIVATWAFIRMGSLSLVEKIAPIHLSDKEDLLHKATGWMLREMGKKDVKKLRNFLKNYSSNMPRTMLRYAIEKFPETERKKWLQKDKKWQK